MHGDREDLGLRVHVRGKELGLNIISGPIYTIQHVALSTHRFASTTNDNRLPVHLREHPKVHVINVKQRILTKSRARTCSFGARIRGDLSISI